jgi:hypothetical protein
MNCAPTATARLRASLDAIAGALQSPNLEALLAAELDLSSALAGLAKVQGVNRADRAAVCSELSRVRAALSRCRLFGSVIEDAAHATLVAQGRASDYDRAGARRAADSARGTLRARM